MASLKKYGPEFARYSIKTKDEKTGVKKVDYIAVMASRDLMHKSTITNPDGSKQFKNWCHQGQVPAGTSIQQYCRQLVAAGYEME